MLLLYTLIAYLTNASCTLAGRLRTHPLDFGLRLGGKRLFGGGKTFEGLLIGFNAGLLLSLLLPVNLIIAIWVVIGSLAGDLLGSFIKRRLNLARGSSFAPMDQLGFLVVAYFALSFFEPVDYLLAVLLLAATYFIHRLTNLLAYRLGLKSVSW